LAAIIIVGIGDIRITDFHGFFGLKPDYFFSLGFTILLFTFLTNGFNLIDGIDGLAAIVGIVTITAFSIWFFINQQVEIPLMGAALIGSLLAFIYYNVFPNVKKYLWATPDRCSLVLFCRW
jgi:UDP-N-acetylmuramyl pentapeptide phosphotransferase/UDP-N-acetylglucosamine-1-phosphate transferase